MRPATYDEILRFLRIDGWVPVRTTGHVHYEKRLPSGETLRTHASVKQPLAATFAPYAPPLKCRGQDRTTISHRPQALAAGGASARPTARMPPTPERLGVNAPPVPVAME